MERPEPHTWCTRNTVQLPWKTGRQFLGKLKIELLFDPVIPLLGLWPRTLKAGSQRDICRSTFIGALSTAAKRRSHSSARWRMNMNGNQNVVRMSVEYDSPLRREEILTFWNRFGSYVNGTFDYWAGIFITWEHLLSVHCGVSQRSYIRQQIMDKVHAASSLEVQWKLCLFWKYLRSLISLSLNLMKIM